MEEHVLRICIQFQDAQRCFTGTTGNLPVQVERDRTDWLLAAASGISLVVAIVSLIAAFASVIYSAREVKTANKAAAAAARAEQERTDANALRVARILADHARDTELRDFQRQWTPFHDALKQEPFGGLGPTPELSTTLRWIPWQEASQFDHSWSHLHDDLPRSEQRTQRQEAWWRLRNDALANVERRLADVQHERDEIAGRRLIDLGAPAAP